MPKKPSKLQPTVALTEAQVRECIAEGVLVRAELEKRIAKMHELTIEQRFTPAR